MPKVNRAPKKIFIEVINRYDWLYEKLVAHNEAREGIAHYIIVSSETLKKKYKAIIEHPDSTVIRADELIEIGNNTEIKNYGTIIDSARQNETKYNCRYLQDIMQQNRNVWGPKVPFAADTWSGINSLPDTTVFANINDCFCQLESVFEKFQPDLVIARPSSIIAIIAIILAGHKNIPCTMPRPARHLSFITWTHGAYSSHEYLRHVYDKKSKLRSMGRFDQEIITPAGSQQVFKKFAKSFELWPLLKNFLVETYNHCHKNCHLLLRGRIGARPKFITFLKRFILEIRTFRFLRKIWLDDLDDIQGRKILFLLPKEPEYTVQSLSREFSNIQALISQLAISLPVDCTLIVKEHSRLGFRKLEFYRELLRFQNLRFVNPFKQSQQYLHACDAAATIAGTVAVESCLIGRRCLIFSPRAEYRFLPNIVYVEDVRAMTKYVDKVLQDLSKNEREKFSIDAIKYYNCLQETCFNAEGTKVFEGTAEISDNSLEKAWKTLVDNYNFQLSNLKNNRQKTFKL